MKGCSFFTFHPELNAWRESVPHTSGIHPLQRKAVCHTLSIEKKSTHRDIFLIKNITFALLLFFKQAAIHQPLYTQNCHD